jgi:hypothetical protein
LPVLPAVRERTEPPEKLGVPGLSLEERTGYRGKTYYELKVEKGRGYCLASHEFGVRLSTEASPESGNELWRFVEADGTATLERTRFAWALETKTLWIQSRTSVALRQVASVGTATVWAYRESTGDVMLVARGADRGRQSTQPPNAEGGDVFTTVSSDCTFGATLLSTKLAQRGTSAQLAGSTSTSERGVANRGAFVIDASVSKLSRDPEPVLAVRIRSVD